MDTSVSSYLKGYYNNANSDKLKRNYLGQMPDLIRRHLAIPNGLNVGYSKGIQGTLPKYTWVSVMDPRMAGEVATERKTLEE